MVFRLIEKCKPRAGIAMDGIHAAVHTFISRKITGPEFDKSPVGLRRRRAMSEGLKRIEAAFGELTDEAPSLDTITAIVALDYAQFRFLQAGWMPRLARLDQLRQQLRTRPSVERSAPY